MLRLWICLLALSAARVAVLEVAAPRSAQARPAKNRGDIPLPPRSRFQPDGSAISGQGFRKTTVFFERYLKRQGIPHKQVPTYQVRGVQVSRFLSTDKRSTWTAIHVFKLRGVTRIFIVTASRKQSQEIPTQD